MSHNALVGQRTANMGVDMMTRRRLRRDYKGISELQAAALQGPLVLRAREIRALLATPDKRTRGGRRDAALLALLACCGLRATECRRLTLDNIEWGKPSRLLIRGLKGGRERTVTLPRQAERTLKAWLDVGKPRLYVFPGRWGDALSLRETQRIVKDALKAIGRGDLRVHSLRHTALSIIVKQTGSIYMAQRVAGHANPQTTARFYLSWDTTQADAAALAVENALG